jgi:hypothetical protein
MWEDALRKDLGNGIDCPFNGCDNPNYGSLAAYLNDPTDKTPLYTESYVINQIDSLQIDSRRTALLTLLEELEGPDYT